MPWRRPHDGEAPCSSASTTERPARTSSPSTPRCAPRRLVGHRRDPRDRRLADIPVRDGHGQRPAATTAPRPSRPGSTASRQALRPGRAGRGHRAGSWPRAGRRPAARPRLARVTPEELSAAIRAALTEAVDAGDLAVAVPAEVRVERPREPRPRRLGHQRRAAAGQGRRHAAARRRRCARRAPGCRCRGSRPSTSPGPASSTSPSTPRRAGELARADRGGGRGVRAHDAEAGQRINLEFVSANPTGPLHLGHTRWAAVGDALRRAPAAAGRRVSRPSTTSTTPAPRWTGSAPSLLARAKGEPTPEDGYPGDYIAELARRGAGRARPTCSTCPTDEAHGGVRASSATPLLLAEIQRDPRTTSASTSTSASTRTPARRRRGRAGRRRGCASRATSSTPDGAVWLRTTDFGDDKDRVLIRANGEPTYFAGRRRLLPARRTAASTR